MHLRSKQMDAAERESRERQQREYEEAKARLQAELEAEWKGKLEGTHEQQVSLVGFIQR